ncbi:MAG: cyclic pyranopterin monophosphate synthase MoaC [Nitrospirae bacterium]|nr:cyclic pyranopterin monophosphate synthase MoaC [Nitrospirota bacterium]
MKGLTHFDKSGKARMVDVSGKGPTVREALAQAAVLMNKKTYGLIKAGAIEKGDVLGVARVSGIMAAKKTPELIPMCHPVNLSSVEIDFRLSSKTHSVVVSARVRCTGPTGVEMEALTAVSAAALTIYDMCKAVDKGMVITDIMLLEKSGGKSGDFRR